MTNALKRKWIAALRSGRYQQGQNALHADRNTFCCLGVLCKVANVPIHGRMGEDVNEDYETLCERTGLTWKQRDRCQTLNDLRLLSFAQIADYIEAAF